MSSGVQQRHHHMGVCIAAFVFCLRLIQLAGASGDASGSGGPDCYSDSAGCRVHGDCCHPVPYRKAAMASVECEAAQNLGIQLPDPPKPAAAATGVRQSGSVLVVQTCPTDADPEADDACRSTQGRARSLFDRRQLPVMAAADGLLFRSAHCARCHGRDRLLWPRVSAQCGPEALGRLNASGPPPERLAQFLRDELQSGRDLPDGCHVVAQFLQPEPHRCRHVIDSCMFNSNASAEERRACEDGGVSLVPDLCGTFRNPACRACYGIECVPSWSGFFIPDSGGGALSNVVNFWIPLNEAGRDDRTSGFIDGREQLLEADDDGGGGKPRRNSSWGTNSSDGGEPDAALQSSGPQGLVLVASYCVSIVSLILLLAVYALLPHLRNRAGQLLMSHAASVLALQAVQLLSMCAGRRLGSGCAALHFLLYFCLLSAFTWAFLFGWDLLRTFSSLLRNSAFKPSRYGRFALIGWGLPTVLTGVLIGLHQGIGLLDVGKGCRYRPDRVAIMIGLSFAPLVAALLFNTAIVCLLAAQLVKTYRETRSAGQSSAAKLCIMTVKVSVIMGLAWLPYFLITLVDRGANPGTAGFAGELLCSLHGLLLTAGFTGNRRVRARLSKMTSSVLKTSSSSDQISSMAARARRSQDAGGRSQGPLLRAAPADRSQGTASA